MFLPTHPPSYQQKPINFKLYDQIHFKPRDQRLFLPSKTIQQPERVNSNLDVNPVPESQPGILSVLTYNTGPPYLSAALAAFEKLGQ